MSLTLPIMAWGPAWSNLSLVWVPVSTPRVTAPAFSPSSMPIAVSSTFITVAGSPTPRPPIRAWIIAGSGLLLPVLDYTKRDALISAEIEVEAERSGSAIRRTDAMIASVAINHGALFYTFNKKHFKSLEDMGLKLFSAI